MRDYITKNDIEYAEKLVKEKFLNCEVRYKHCMDTAIYAKELAKIHDIDEDEAYFCGLMHDFAKYESHDTIINYLNEYEINDEYFRNDLELAHGFVGAFMVSKIFNLDLDSNIINSIKFHTVGKKNPTKLEMLVYVSDLLEPNRNYQEIDKLRYIAKKDLVQATLKTAILNLKYMLDNNIIIHYNVLEMINSLRNYE